GERLLVDHDADPRVIPDVACLAFVRPAQPDREGAVTPLEPDRREEDRAIAPVRGKDGHDRPLEKVVHVVDGQADAHLIPQAGRLNEKRVDRSSDPTPTRPPTDSTSWRTMARPIPAPPCAWSRDFSTR